MVLTFVSYTGSESMAAAAAAAAGRVVDPGVVGAGAGAANDLLTSCILRLPGVRQAMMDATCPRSKSAIWKGPAKVSQGL